MVMPYFIFNDINSLDYNMHINKMPPTHTTENKGQYVEVPGRDGYLFISDGRKAPIVKSFDVTIFPDDYLEQIKRWLRGSGNLISSNEPNVYFKARIQSMREYLGVYNEKTVSVSFACQPWAYLLSGDNVITISTTDTIINNPEEIAKPLIKIYGTGAVDLIVNSNIHKFNITDYVTVDSELMECYKDNTLATFTGDFPELLPGENIISWTGTVTKVEVTPRWRR